LAVLRGALQQKAIYTTQRRRKAGFSSILKKSLRQEGLAGLVSLEEARGLLAAAAPPPWA